MLFSKKRDIFLFEKFLCMKMKIKNFACLRKKVVTIASRRMMMKTFIKCDTFFIGEKW
jgi:hypothetical protein